MNGAVKIFEKLTGYNLTDYLTRYSTFISTHKNTLFQYYQGLISVIDIKIFNERDYLLGESRKISTLLFNVNRNFDNLDGWELVDTLDNITTSLETIKNLKRWTRSQIDSSEKIQQYVLSQYETLEKVTETVGDTWQGIAINNSIIEEDYDLEGGQILSMKVNPPRNGVLEVNGVVDTLEGEKIYGKDVNSELKLQDSDLEVLDYIDTFEQSAKILLNLKKGQVEEFSSRGLDTEFFVGTVKSALSYPAIFRQIYSNFSSDDTFSSISIESVEQSGDSVFITVRIVGVLGDQLQEILRV